MLDVLLVSVKATAKIVLICAGGAYLQRVGIFTKEVRKGVSEAFVKLLLPCMLVTRIVPTISVQTLPIVAWLSIANVTYVTVGWVLGQLTARISQPAPHLYSIIAIAPAIGHSNSIPFLLLELICDEYEGFRQGDAEKAQGYVGLYLIMHSITLWGVGLSTIKEKESEKLASPTSSSAGHGHVQSISHTSHSQSQSESQSQPQPQTLGNKSGSDAAVSAEGPHSESAPGDAESAAGPPVRVSGPASVTAPAGGEPRATRGLCSFLVSIVGFGFGMGGDPFRSSPASRRQEDHDVDREAAWAESVSSMETGAVPTLVRNRLSCRPDSLMGLLPKWLNRPVVTALVAALLGLSPSFQSLVSEETGFLHFAFGAMDQMGSGGSMMALLTVGALFTADGVPKPWVIGYRPLVGVLLSRLVVLPCVCIPLWMTLRRYLPLFPGDKIFMLVICIECCTPSAYNLVTMCVLQGRNPTDIAAALFYQNMVAILTITAWVTVILYYVI